jgi:acetyl esterase/lipase
MADAFLAETAGRATLETTTIAGVTVHVGTPTEIREPYNERVWMTIHGGAFILMGGAWARSEAAFFACERGCIAYSVDFRLATESPYPAALDDILAVYRSLLERYEGRDIGISGGSAGGTLALAAVLKARDEGLAMPGALLLNSPLTDLTYSGDTIETLRDIDAMLPRPLIEPVTLYAGDHDSRDPYLSPLFADFDAGFPPTCLESGTRDLLLSDCVRLHRAMRGAGVDAELHVWEAAPHGGFALGTPEREEMRAEEARFLAKHWGADRNELRPASRTATT